MKPKQTGHSIKLSLKSVIALLIMASASLVGAQTLQTLCSFNGTNGANPTTLMLGTDGNFYGTTLMGGTVNSNYPSGAGTLFKVTTNGTLTMLYSFSGTDGACPEGALALGADSNFYNTTLNGGRDSYGTVFKISPDGVLTSLYSFTGYPDGPNGGNPAAGLVQGNDGNFYGTTKYGGIYGIPPLNWPGFGTVFKITTNGILTMLVSFPVGNSATNGYWLEAGLTLGYDGNFYSTTELGGNCDYGTVFKVTTNGVLTTLVSFSGTNGTYPEAALTLGNDGNFYGTAYYGGITNSAYTNGMGTVFKVTTNGTLTALVYFNGTNGMGPSALTLGTDGNFYGTTSNGGITNSLNPSGLGTVFHLLIPPVVPPTLALQFVAGYPQLNLAGTLGNNFVVQYSTNLADTNWINLLSMTNLSSSPYLFLDPAGVVPPARYYRAFMQ